MVPTVPKIIWRNYLCALLLLNVSKKCDLEFDTPHRSSHHTVRSTDDDVTKMTKYLIEVKVMQECDNRVLNVEFKDPLVIRMQKVVDGWLNKFESR